MRGKFLLLFAIISIFLISGCSQTGSIINKSSETHVNSGSDEPVDHIQQDSGGDTSVIPIAFESKENITHEAETVKDDVDVVVGAEEAEEAKDPCKEITCPDSVTVCDDGYKARCSNRCSDGACSICKPDCSGHEIAEAEEEESCELSCGICEDENEEACQCDIIVPCDGNGICEQGEYPDSDDCPDCDDSDSCTEDLYDFGTQECQISIIVPCCGNGVCENETEPPEDNDNCPTDCNVSQPMEPAEPSDDPLDDDGNWRNISITFIEPNEEWVEINNPGNGSVELSNWSLSDAASHVFTFPDFIMEASLTVRIHTGTGDDNSTDLFWGRGDSIWNNKGDNATLMDGIGEIVSTYSY